MNKIRGHVNTLDILKYIIRHNHVDRDTYTIIITGRVGPTGKTWLCTELCKLGYRAMENTRFTMSQLLKDDGVNHVIVDEDAKQVMIVLNEILPMYENKWCKVSNFDPTNVYTFKTCAEAYDILRKMRDIAYTYGLVTRADFKTLIGMPCSYDESKYGWFPDAIRKARVVRLRHGYFIEFPRALPIM